MKYLLSSILIFTSFYFAEGQCSDIDAPCSINTANTEFIYNDDLETGESSLVAYVNNYYQTNFQVNVPADTSFNSDFGEIDLDIDYIVIQEIEGLPEGLEFECSNSGCSFNGGDFGCFSLIGTPTEIGIYSLNLVVNASGSLSGLPLPEQTFDDLIQITLIVEECSLDGCYDDFGDFYNVGSELFLDDTGCTYIWCEGENNWSDVITIDTCLEEVCDTVYVEVEVPVTVYVPVIITDTIVEIEYVDVIVTDTIVEFQDIIITEYVDCETFLPCESGIDEILDKSKSSGKIYNLLGQEMIQRQGIYIEDGEVKYRLY